ncbi:putative vacuolar aspartyl aminopeptidase Lap4, partial [Sistotremastrum niveocremeum HHB9708]
MSPPPYAEEFIHFIDQATTVYHAVDWAQDELESKGYSRLKEDDDWPSILKPGGKYYVTRNATSIIAFAIGKQFISGGPLAMIGSHIDALTLKVKPVSLSEKGGYERLAIAPYSGGGPSQSFDGSYSTWWDRDLGLAGRVLVQAKNGNVEQKLVQFPTPIARIPSLAVHFGAPARGPFNWETNFIPVVGLAKPGDSVLSQDSGSVYGPVKDRHSARLLKAISREIGVPVSSIVDFDLELYDFQSATTLGLSDEFISAPRLDDKLCSFSALKALTNLSDSFLDQSSAVHLVGLFDNEEIGSGLRQGAKSNFIQTVIERLIDAQVGVKEADKSPFTSNLIGQSLASSFLISADVTHAFNPNFPGVYLPGASPELNKGVVIKAEPNGRSTTTSTGKVLLSLVAEASQSELQLFHIRNDGRSGGTIGPMVSERLGCPTIDVGIPQLSMHSIRGITGSADPGIGVKFFQGFFEHYEHLREKIEF